MKPKIIRMTTVPISMNTILKGQLQYINQFYEVVGLTGKDDKHFSAIAKREGIRMVEVKMTRTISLMKDIKTLWKLIKIFRKEQPAIVHTHTPKAGLLGMLAAWLVRVPVRLHTVGGMPLLGKKGWKKQLLLLTERLTYRMAQRIYSNSKGLAAILLEEGLVKTSKLKVMGKGSSNGVDVQYFQGKSVLASKVVLRIQWGIPSDAKVFLFVGRLAQEKGIVELIEAFIWLYSQDSNCCLVLVGPFEKEHGALSKQVKMTIESHPGIRYLGRFDDVRPFHKLSDVFVFPSYREGFPNALLEACAMELACIASNINGCNEIIASRQNGILVPPKQTSVLQAAMWSLLQDESLRQQYGYNARQTVERFFQNAYLWECWKHEYDRWCRTDEAL